MSDVRLTTQKLSIRDVVSVARGFAKVELSTEATENVQKAQATVEKAVSEGRIVYGVTTGFGALSDKIISKKDVEKLQRNLLRSHAAGVGEPLDTETTRALMILRANTLARGYSGISCDTLQLLIRMLNAHIHPVVPGKGSVGASGDLAPLAHMALAMIGEGKVEYKGRIMQSNCALKKASLDTAALGPKEGLALINGSQLITAIGALTVHDSENLLKTSQVATAMSLEAMNGRVEPFDKRIHMVRPHAGQIAVAENILKIVEGSLILHEPSNKRVQDAYSLRCSPQVIGASKDAIEYVRRVVEVEINSATDNPLVFAEDGEILSGGNFHGQPLAIAMDLLAISLCNIGNICERRIARLTDEKLSGGLPPFLLKKSSEEGVSSGFMIAQCTAASLAAENRCLSNPSSVNSIPTSANQEDHVSMGVTAARKAKEILKNTEHVVAIELLCAAQGLEFRGVNNAGIGTLEAYRLIRKVAPSLEEDTELSPLIEAVASLVHKAELVDAIEKKVGKFN
ncbi:MAG: histidine ammonia-lyase [Candidatus Atabeyarchaeum deiterrae]